MLVASALRLVLLLVVGGPPPAAAADAHTPATPTKPPAVTSPLAAPVGPPVQSEASQPAATVPQQQLSAEDEALLKDFSMLSLFSLLKVLDFFTTEPASTDRDQNAPHRFEPE